MGKMVDMKSLRKQQLQCNIQMDDRETGSEDRERRGTWLGTMSNMNMSGFHIGC